MDLRILFLLFMIYSCLGWIMEVVLVSLQKGKLVTRGFLIGPYLPIYGFGATFITMFLSRYYDDIVVLFVMSCVLGALLEYFTSYIMEKIFKTRWWDYSNRKYNINGRVCVNTTLSFGLLGVILIRYLNPFFENLLNGFPNLLLTFLAMILWIIIVLDTVVSFNIISNIKRTYLSSAKDTTEEVSKIVKEKLKNSSILYKRLVNAFPNLKFTLYKNFENIKNKTTHKDV